MKTVFLFVLIFFLELNCYGNDRVVNILNQLDQAIENKETYQKKKEERIKSLKLLLSNDPEKEDLAFRYKIYEKVFEEYKSYRFDSAFSYANKLLTIGYQLEDSLLINRGRIKLSFSLVSAGMFKESLDTLQAIQHLSGMGDQNFYEYYLVYSRIYNDLAEYADDPHYAPLYTKLVIHYHELLLSNFDKTNSNHYHKLGEKLSRENKIPEAIRVLHKLLDKKDLPKSQFAQASSNLGQLYKAQKNYDKAIEYFALAAVADIKAGIKETVAARELANLVYQQGDYKRAYSYVQLAMEDARFYNAKHRKVQISYILPLIEGKKLSIIDDQRRNLLYYSVAITALSFLVVLFVIIILKQFRRLKQVKANLAESHQNLQKMNLKLQEVNKIKEGYIGQFFNSMSEYIDRIEKFKNNVNRKVASRKIEEIYDIIHGINSNKEREGLFLNFDTTFLKIFPGFVEDINNLFDEGDKLIIKENQPLTPELRIFALIRLGIHENEKIAKILGYSVNTIYTYKTKIKNKSIVPNDEFEKKIMDIKGL